MFTKPEQIRHTHRTGPWLRVKEGFKTQMSPESRDMRRLGSTQWGTDGTGQVGSIQNHSSSPRPELIGKIQTRFSNMEDPNMRSEGYT